jgi:hypothetical protein
MIMVSYNRSFIVQATVIMSINYYCKTFIVQTTGRSICFCLISMIETNKKRTFATKTKSTVVDIRSWKKKIEFSTLGTKN